MKIFLRMLLCGISVFVFWQCSNNGPGDIAGPITETGNPKLACVFVDAQGNAVAGAKVFVYKTIVSNDTINRRYPLRLMAIDSTNTGNYGNVEFMELKPDTYTIESRYNAGNLFALKKGIVFDSTRIVSDTLLMKEPGNIQGFAFRGEKDYQYPSSGFLLVNVEGLLSQLTVPSYDGEFWLTNIPEGVYTIGFYSSDNAYYNKFVDSVRVSSGSIVDLGIIHLTPTFEAPPPRPAGFTARYDSVNGLVYLSWHSVGISNLLGYQVMRKYQMSETTFKTAILIDTFYVDTVTAFPDSARIVYLLKTIDRAYNESMNAGPVEVINKEIVEKR